MNYDISRPWLTLDTWQKKYIFDKEDKDNFLLCGRQVGKTTALSLRAVELCVKHYKKGDYVMINSITEKQAYRILSLALAYAREKYSNYIVDKGKDKPTMHKVLFKNGSGILCYASGESGAGIRGYTIKKLMCDEASRMSKAYFTAVSPMISVSKGSMDLASTPCGKEGFFYEASLDEHFNKYYVSAEDCPRHTKDYLEREKKRMSEVRYSQEYRAVFMDELKRLYSDEWIEKICVLKRPNKFIKVGKTYLGVDVAGLGEDETTFEVFHKLHKNNIEQVDNIVTRRKYTTDTSRYAIELDGQYKFDKIGVDDGGVGFGVFSELLYHYRGKEKVEALNNSHRRLNWNEKGREKKLLKEDMHHNLVVCGEQKKIKLLDDDEIKASLRSVQFEVVLKENKKSEERIFGNDTHIAEGIVRAVWLASSDEGLNLWSR